MEQYMYESPRWNFIEGMFNKLPFPYPIVSLVIGILISFGYFIFMSIIKIEDFQYDIYFGSQVLFSSTLIVYMLAGNQYIADKLRDVFKRLEFVSYEEKYSEELYDFLEKNYNNSKKFFLLTFTLISPFALKDFLEICVLGTATYEECFFSSPIFNVYNYAVFILELYLLSNALWIILNISKILKLMAKYPYSKTIKIDIFNADKIGGLGQIKSFIINIFIYYSIGISLAILAYVDSSEIESVYFEIIFLILLLIAGGISLFTGLQVLQGLFRSKIIEELDQINEKDRKLYERLIEVVSDNSNEGKEEILQLISKSEELLSKERSERERILNDSKNKYNLAMLFSTLTSSIMLLFSLYEKLNNFGITNWVLDIFRVN